MVRRALLRRPRLVGERACDAAPEPRARARRHAARLAGRVPVQLRQRAYRLRLARRHRAPVQLPRVGARRASRPRLHDFRGAPRSARHGDDFTHTAQRP